MIGILNRWRQFGRRYFWPHLLLGMVAATLGVPQNLLDTSDQTSLPSASSSLNRQTSANSAFNNLALLQEAHRHPTFGVDYWHQHALRTVIRHLSFALAPQTVYARVPDVEVDAAEPPLQAVQLALLSTLNALLMHESKPPTIIRDTNHPIVPSLAQHQPGLWLAQVQGIRAGPALLN